MNLCFARVQYLTVNFMECIVVSLEHVQIKLFKDPFLLYLKEKLLLMNLRSHRYGYNV